VTTLISFLLFITLFIGVGLYSVKFKKKSVNDYYVASRSIPAPLVGLSAIATMMSGFMFLGAVGAVYKHGLIIAWMFIASLIVHIFVYIFYIGKFARICESRSYSSFTQFLSKFNGKFFYKYSVVASIIILMFVGAMASAQLLSGAKTLHSFYDVDLNLGALLVVTIVILYCYAGGIRASIWTDAIQSVVMLIAMFCLIGTAIYEIGGFGALYNKLDAIDTKYTSFLINNSYAKTTSVFSGWFFLCFSAALGLPYIMIRYMTLADTGKVKQVGICFNTYLASFYILSVLAGLCARVLILPEDLPDTEYAFLILSERLLPEFVIGIVLAGIFSSIISSTDSFVLTCSASITKDLFPKLGNKYVYAKLATLFVGLVIYLIYLSGSKNVFDLVLLALGVIGSSFAPIVFLFMYNKKPTEIVQILMTVVSVIVFVYWNKHYHNVLNEATPAVLSSFLIYGVSEVYYKIKKVKIKRQFAIGE
jgi:SSS family transporter